MRRWGIPSVYAGTVLAMLAALAVRWMLHPVLGESSPFLAFVLAVLLASWVGGWRPGLLAAMLSALVADYFFLAPLNDFGVMSANQAVQLGLFLGVSLLISGFNDRLRTP